MDVAKVARLANLSLTQEELKKFPEQFAQTLSVVDQLKEINTSGVGLTAQVTGLFNVGREDEIDRGRRLSQEEALSQAKRAHKGFFVVKQILEK